jgi:phosphoglycolate phosphatase
VSQGSGLIRPDAVIFDWDGTLADNWGAIGRSLNATFSAFDRPTWSTEEVRQRTKQSARDAFPKLFGEHWEQALAYFYDQFEAFHADEVRPLPGAADLLRALTEGAVPMAVVSNKNGAYLRIEAERLGWTHFFGNIVGATDAPRDKPAIDPVHLALAGSRINPGASVWFIGDTVSDLECAHRSDCVPILIEGGAVTEQELLDWRPQAVFPSCMALTDAFLDCTAG